jgi:hypothetical protein
MGTSINLIVTSVIVSFAWLSRAFLPIAVKGSVIDIADPLGSVVAQVNPKLVFPSDFDTLFLIVLAIIAPLILVVVAKARQHLEITK